MSGEVELVGKSDVAEPATPAGPVRSRRVKKGLRRRGPDRSQSLRSGFQIAFLALNVWIGTQFLLWVHYFEQGGHGWNVSRPPGVEGWLPIASLMNLKAWILGGTLPKIHPAGVFLLLAFLAMSFLVRKSFCSWLCPVGTLSETLGRWGVRWFGRNFQLPAWLDLPLRSLKYLLMGLFLYAVGMMSVESIRAFLDGPYGVVADVKMLNFFRNLGGVGAVTIGVLLLLSLLVRHFWCRYLCPYGALLGLVGLLSPVRIERDADRCIDCGKCARACPSHLPVDQLLRIRSAECSACLQCVAACPVEQAVDLRLAGRATLRPWWVAAVVAGIFFSCVLVARLSGHWQTDLPDTIYQELVPKADRFSHP